MLKQKHEKLNFISIRLWGDKETIKAKTLKTTEFTFHQHKMV